MQGKDINIPRHVLSVTLDTFVYEKNNFIFII